MTEDELKIQELQNELLRAVNSLYKATIAGYELECYSLVNEIRDATAKVETAIDSLDVMQYEDVIPLIESLGIDPDGVIYE